MKSGIHGSLFWHGYEGSIKREKTDARTENEPNC